MDQIFSPCGINCNSCPWYKHELEPKCPGCYKLKGKPFWGNCETYTCTQNNQVEHCGLCVDFPCREFMTRYDPREGPANALIRAGLLAYLAKYSDKETLELLEKAENFEKKNK